MTTNPLRTLLAGLVLMSATWAAPIDLASVENVGPGTAGSLGVPGLEIVGLPAVGQPMFDARITNGLPLAAAQLLVSTSLDPVDLPDFGATLWPGLELARLPTVLDPTGSSPAFTAPGPTPASLDGLGFVVQALVIDPAATGGIAFTNGVALTIGLGSAAAPLFASPQLFIDPVAPLTQGAVAAGDLDGNGVPEIVATRTGAEVVVGYGMPDGSHVPGGVYDSGVGEALDLHLVDLNGDNLLDLVATGPGGVAARLGLAGGSLGPLVAPGSTGLPAGRSVLVDADGDELLDIVFVTSSGGGGLVLMTGLGNGAFGPALVLSLTTGSVIPIDVAAGDLNGDGVVDLVAIDGPHSFGRVFVLLGLGGGSFAQPTPTTLPTNTRFPRGVACGDLDGNGRDDVTVVSFGGGFPLVPGRLEAYLSQPDGTLGPAITEETNVATAQGVTLHDLEGDGLLDALVRTNGGLTTLVGGGDGTFVEILTSAGSLSLDAVLTALPGDEVPDVVVLQTDGMALAMAGDGAGGFSSGAASSWPLGAMPFALIDLNGDGLLDLAAGRAGVGLDLRFSLGLGNGTFSQAQVVPLADPLATAAVADVTGDGIPDVLTSEGQLKLTARLRPGFGDGTFGAPVDLPAGPLPVQLVPVDVDGNGALDIVGLSFYSDQAWVLHNDGGGTFTFGATVPLHDGAFGIVLGDVGQDGVPDLAVSNLGSSAASVHLGDGQGGFGPAIVTPTIAKGFAHLADLNADGLADLAVLSIDLSIGGEPHAGLLEVRLGLGDGSFGPPAVHEVPETNMGMSFGDVNGDGALDIVLAATSGVSVLLGFGDGGLAPAQPFAAPGGPALLGDLDGDGDLDIVTGSNQFTAVLLNSLR